MAADQAPPLPYFDLLLALLAQDNPSIRKSFGRHVHWGYWPEPALAACDDQEFAEAAERLTRRVCDLAAVGDSASVLDAGCGFGGTIASLNERFSGLDLVGLNIDGRQLARAEQLVRAEAGNRIRWIEGDACALPFEDASFDRVLAVECVFHFPSREQFFREAFRVLRPGGMLALSDFVPLAPLVPLARWATEAPTLQQYQYFGRCNVRFSLGKYRALAAASGFTIAAEENATGRTLPTYDYLQMLLREKVRIEGISERIIPMLGILKTIARLGLVKYRLFAFRKPG